MGEVYTAKVRMTCGRCMRGIEPGSKFTYEAFGNALVSVHLKCKSKREEVSK
jgi:hypothetical protein